MISHAEIMKLLERMPIMKVPPMTILGNIPNTFSHITEMQGNEVPRGICAFH